MVQWKKNREVRILPGKRDDFFDELFGESRMSSEEIRAFRKEIPMTEELLSRIIEKLMRLNLYEWVVKLAGEYEPLFDSYVEKEAARIKNIPLPDDCRTLTEEETAAAYENLMKRVSETP